MTWYVSMAVLSVKLVISSTDYRPRPSRGTVHGPASGCLATYGPPAMPAISPFCSPTSEQDFCAKADVKPCVLAGLCLHGPILAEDREDQGE